MELALYRAVDRSPIPTQRKLHLLFLLWLRTGSRSRTLGGGLRRGALHRIMMET